MKRSHDLDALDRATVVVWRASNVVGWGVAGLALYAFPGIVFREASDALQGRISAVVAAPLVMVFVIGVLVLLPAFVGRLVGEHVVRFPALVAALAVTLPNVVVLTASEGRPDRSDAAVMLAVAGIGALIASVTARDRWSKRPRALRSPGAR